MPWIIGARRYYAHKQFLKLLKKRCNEVGGQSKFAMLSGVSRQHVTNVLAGRRLPGKEILNTMGMDQELIFIDKKLADKK